MRTRIFKGLPALLGVMICVLASRNSVLTLIACSIIPFLALTNIIFEQRVS